MTVVRRIVIGFVLSGTAAVSGCGGSTDARVAPLLSGRVGENCTVYFRRDALGMAAAVPSPPTTGNHNGADTMVSGKLVRINSEWIVVVDGQREFTIPKLVILMVETRSK